MKKIISVLLAIVLVLSLAACASSAKPAGQEDSIVGTWKGSLDMSQILKDALEEEGMEVPADVGDISFAMIFTFTEEGTVTVDVDQESLTAMATKVVDFMLETTISALKDQGIDLSAMGMSEESIRQMLEQYVNPEELISSMDMTQTDGYYLYKDGKIYGGDTKEELNDVSESQDYMVVELKGNQLTILDIVAEGEKATDDLSFMFPIVLTKQ